MSDKPQKTERVQRVAELDDQRYSIQPADAVLDANLTLPHFRVLGYIGRVNTSRGWCEFSQKAFSKLTGINRTTINLALSDLVRWRYVELRTQKTTRSSFCHYRTLIDDPFFDAEAEHAARGGVSAGDNTPPEGGVSAGDNTPPVGGVSAGDNTCVGSTQHGSRLGTTPPISKARARSRSEIRDPSPPTPREDAGGWASGWGKPVREAVDELRKSALIAYVATNFVDEVRGTLSPPKGVDGAAFVRQLASRLGRFDATVLKATAQHMLDTRGHNLPAAPEIERAAARLAKLPPARPAPIVVDAARVERPSIFVAHAAAVRARLEERVGPDVFASWFADLEVEQIAGDLVTVSVPVKFVRTWIETHWSTELADAVRASIAGAERVKVIALAEPRRTAA